MQKTEYQLDFIIQNHKKERKIHVVIYAWEGYEYTLFNPKTLCSLKVDENSKEWEELEGDNCDSYEFIKLSKFFNDDFIKRASEFLSSKGLLSSNRDFTILKEVNEMAGGMFGNTIWLEEEDGFDLCEDCMMSLIEKKGYTNLLKFISKTN